MHRGFLFYNKLTSVTFRTEVMAEAGAGHSGSRFLRWYALVYTVNYQGITRLTGLRRTDARSHRVDVAKSQGISHTAREGLARCTLPSTHDMDQ